MISPGREPGVPRAVNSQAPEGRQETEMRASFVNARISVAAPRLFFLFLAPYLGLLTAFGRRDAPSPASGRWPAILGLGHCRCRRRFRVRRPQALGESGGSSIQNSESGIGRSTGRLARQILPLCGSYLIIKSGSG